jgi:SAM-dependent methyltransferase
MNKPTYHELRFSASSTRYQVWAAIVAYLQRFVSLSGTVADLGAGDGAFLDQIPATTRIAIDAETLPTAAFKTEVTNIVGRAELFSALNLSQLDAVLASNLLEHLDHNEAQSCLDGIFSALRPGGCFIAVQPNFRYSGPTYFDDYTHKTIYTDRSLSDLLKSRGFEVTRCEPRFLPLTMQSKLSIGAKFAPLYLRLPYRPLAGQMLVIAKKPQQDTENQQQQPTTATKGSTDVAR